MNAGQRLEIVSVVSLMGEAWAAAYSGPDRTDVLRDLALASGLAGEAANAALTGTFRGEVLIGLGAGSNVLRGLDGADTLIADANDTASYLGSDAAVDIALTRASQLGGHAEGDVLSGVTRVTGSGFADRISGSLVSLPNFRVAEVFNGGVGNDTLTGLYGDDSLFGGGDADRLYGGSDQDRLDGGLGDDGLYGGSGNDTLIGGDGADTLSGGTGADLMDGGRGSDTYTVDTAGDRVDEYGGLVFEIDTVIASASFTLAPLVSVEVLRTSDASATTTIDLTGNGRAQAITGNAGANRLAGGGGVDTLTGGAGADVFVFEVTPGARVQITDFDTGADVIELSSLVFAGLSQGALDPTAFAANFSGSPSAPWHRILYETTTGELWYDADGNGAGARVLVAELTAGLGLGAAQVWVA